MKAVSFLPVASLLISAANASPVSLQERSAQWYGTSQVIGDNDYCLLCEDQPDTYYVSKPLCCETGNCDGSNCPCQRPQKVKTVTIRPELPTFSRYDPPTPASSTSTGAAATVTVSTTATITTTGTLTTTATSTTISSVVPTQPVHNQGFNGGVLSPWIVNVGTNGGSIVGSNTYGLLDFDPSVNSTMGAADFQIPLTTTATTFATPQLSQVVNLLGNSTYLLSFFIASPTNLNSLANINVPGASSLVAGILGLSSATGATASVLSSSPVASLAGCQVTAAIGGVSTQFPLYSGTAAAPTALVSLVNTGGTPTWTRFDLYFPTTTAGPSNLDFTVTCPGLANALSSTQLSSVTGLLSTLGTGALGTLTSGLNINSLSTAGLGNILSGLGLAQLDILLDQVAVDFYNAGTA